MSLAEETPQRLQRKRGKPSENRQERHGRSTENGDDLIIHAGWVRRTRRSRSPRGGWWLLRSTSGIIIREVASEETDLSEECLDRFLDARKMTDLDHLKCHGYGLASFRTGRTVRQALRSYW